MTLLSAKLIRTDFTIHFPSWTQYQHTSRETQLLRRFKTNALYYIDEHQYLVNEEKRTRKREDKNPPPAVLCTV